MTEDYEWECDLGPITNVKPYTGSPNEYKGYGECFRGIFPRYPGYINGIDDRLYFYDGFVPGWMHHKCLTPRRVIKNRPSLQHIGLID